MSLPPPPEPAPRPKGLLRFALGLVIALTATGGYIALLLPELGYAPAIPLHIGCVLFLFLLWTLPFSRKASRTFSVGLVAFGLVVAGYVNLMRAEDALRESYDSMRRERTAMPDGRRFDIISDDPFAKELEALWSFPPMIRTADGFRVDLSGRTKVIRLIEEKRPGWPRALAHCIRRNAVEMPPRKKDDEFTEYGNEPRMGCGHYWGRGLGLSSYNFYSYAVTVERRLLDRANEDREVFLQLWKKLPPEERGEEIGK